MWEPITGFFIERLYQLLPKWLDQRLLPPIKVAEKLEIDLQRDTPIEFWLGTDPPRVTVNLRVANHSPITVELDRTFMDIWVGAPFLYDAPLLHRYTLKPGEKERLVLNAFFDKGHLVNFRSQVEPHTGLLREVSISGTCYFVYRVGWIRKDFMFRQTKVAPEGLPKEQ